jgi:hypothetical protein
LWRWHVERGISSPEAGVEPRTAQDISPQLDFLYRAESAFCAWVQFADAKAGGVTLLLGIGLLDLIRRSGAMVTPTRQAAPWGWIATVTSPSRPGRSRGSRCGSPK